VLDNAIIYLSANCSSDVLLGVPLVFTGAEGCVSNSSPRACCASKLFQIPRCHMFYPVTMYQV